MTLIDRGTLPAVAPLGATYGMDQPIQIEQDVWALPQYRKGAPLTELPVVQTYRWGQWGTPLGTATYSRAGVPGGVPTLTAGYLHRNGVIGPGSPALTVSPWQPSPLPGATAHLAITIETAYESDDYVVRLIHPLDAHFATTSPAIQDGRPDRWAQVGMVVRHRLHEHPDFGPATSYDGFSMYLDGRLFPVANYSPVKMVSRSGHLRWVSYGGTDWGRVWNQEQITRYVVGSLPFRLGISPAFFVAIGSQAGYGASIAVLNRATGQIVTRVRTEHITAGPLIRGTKLLYYATDPDTAGFTRRVVVDLATMVFTVERTEEYVVQHAPVAPSYLTDIPRLTTQGVLLMDDDSLDLGLELTVPSTDSGDTSTADPDDPFGWGFWGSAQLSELERTTLSVSANTILITTIPAVEAPILQRSATYTPVTEGGVVRAIQWTGETELDFGAHRSKGHFS